MLTTFRPVLPGMALLVILLPMSMLWPSTAGQPPFFPRKPWHAECYLIISEVRTRLHVGGVHSQEFIELERVCKPGVPRLDVNLMQEFKVIQIKASTKEIVHFCSVTGRIVYTGKARTNPFIVIGNQQTLSMNYAMNTPKINIDLNSPNCIQAADEAFGYSSRDETYGILLLHHKGPTFFSPLMPPAVTGQRGATPVMVDGFAIKKIRESLQDMVIYGYQAPPVMPEIFTQIPNSYVPPGNYFLAIPTDRGTALTSLNRCTSSHLPFKVSSFKLARATPGEPNDCASGIEVFQTEVVTVQPPKRPRIETDNAQQRNIAPVSSVEGVDVTGIEGQGSESAWLDTLRIRHSESIDIEKVRENMAWFEYDKKTDSSQDAYRCRKCNHVLKHGIVKERESSPLRDKLMKESGVIISSPNPSRTKSAKGINNDIMFDHVRNPIHQMAEEYYRLNETCQSKEEVSKAIVQKGTVFRTFYNSTANLIRVIITAAKMHLPFNSFPKLVGLLNYFDSPIGHLYHNGPGMSSIVKTIGDSVHTQLINFLMEKDLEISIAVDSSHDIEVLDHLNVELNFVDTDFKVYSFLYKYVGVGVDKTGSRLLELLKEEFAKDGILDYMKRNIISASFDSAPVMLNTFYRALNEFADNKVLPIPCYAHRISTVLKHAYKGNAVTDHIDLIINELYKFYHQSGKCNSHLRTTARQEDDKPFKLHRLYKVRFVAGRVRSIDTLIMHHRTLAVDLESIPKDALMDKNKRVTANQLYANITDRSFMTNLAFMADVSQLFNGLSLEYQTTCNSIVGQHERHTEFLKELDGMGVQDGPYLQHLLDSSTCDGQACTLELFETAEVVKFDTILMEYTIKLQNRFLSRLSETRTGTISKIKTEFTELFQEQIYRDTDIFHPDKLSSLTSTDAVRDKIIRLNRWFQWVPHRNNDLTQVNQLINQYVSLVSSVTRDSSYTENKKLLAHKFWHNYAERESIAWSPTVKRMLRFLLSLSVSTAQCERNFSLMNKEKVKSRASMAASTAESLVRLRRNLNEVITEEEYVSFAKDFCSKHSRADDVTRVGSAVSVDSEATEDIVVPFRATAV